MTSVSSSISVFALVIVDRFFHSQRKKLSPHWQLFGFQMLFELLSDSRFPSIPSLTNRLHQFLKCPCRTVSASGVVRWWRMRPKKNFSNYRNRVPLRVFSFYPFRLCITVISDATFHWLCKRKVK